MSATSCWYQSACSRLVPSALFWRAASASRPRRAVARQRGESAQQGQVVDATNKAASSPNRWLLAEEWRERLRARKWQGRGEPSVQPPRKTAAPAPPAIATGTT